MYSFDIHVKAGLTVVTALTFACRCLFTLFSTVIACSARSTILSFFVKLVIVALLEPVYQRVLNVSLDSSNLKWVVTLVLNALLEITVKYKELTELLRNSLNVKRVSTVKREVQYLTQQMRLMEAPVELDNIVTLALLSLVIVTQVGLVNLLKFRNLR